MNTHEITLDVSKEPAHEPTLYLGQGDMNGTTLVVNMFDNGEVLDLTGLSVKFCMRTPDMLEFYEVAGAVSGNVATFSIDETYAAGHPGSTDIAYVQVIDGDTESTSTARMRVVVLPSAKDGVDPAPAYKELIDEFIEENQEAVDEIIEAAQEVLDDGIPLMTSTRRGGAMLGTGLAMTDEVLSVDIAAAGGIPAAQKGAANGVAELDQNGLVLSSQLPSYVDDVLEYASTSQFPATGESGKIYVAVDTNLTYRWTGSAYTEISPSLALGETSSTAYRGDRGAAAYAHAVTNKGSAFSSNLYKITTNSEGHVTAATAATSADIIAFLNNQALTPASVTASGTIQGGTISDGVGTLAQLRDSVGKINDYSLALKTSYNATPTNYSTYNGRKFSDYKLLYFGIGTANDVRCTLIVPTSTFTSGSTMIASILHGSAGTSASGYNVSSMNISYVNDTTFNAYVAGTGTINYLDIHGLS